MNPHAVRTLRGLDIGRSDRMAKFLRGYAVTGGRIHIPVDYGDGLFDSYSRAVGILTNEVHEALIDFDRVTIMGHSRGATVIQP